MSRKLDEVLKISPTGIWSVRNSYFLELVLRVQAIAGRRNIAPVWFWRYKKENVPYDAIYREARQKLYDDPIAALLCIKTASPKRKLERGIVEDELSHDFMVDATEAIRLGEVFNVDDTWHDFKFYLPRANDLYQWNNSIYQIGDMQALKYHKLLDGFVVWTGVGTLYSGDSAAPICPLPTSPAFEAPVWTR